MALTGYNQTERWFHPIIMNASTDPDAINSNTISVNWDGGTSTPINLFQDVRAGVSAPRIFSGATTLDTSETALYNAFINNSNNTLTLNTDTEIQVHGILTEIKEQIDAVTGSDLLIQTYSLGSYDEKLVGFRFSDANDVGLVIEFSDSAWDMDKRILGFSRDFNNDLNVGPGGSLSAQSYNGSWHIGKQFRQDNSFATDLRQNEEKIIFGSGGDTEYEYRNKWQTGPENRRNYGGGIRSSTRRIQFMNVPAAKILRDRSQNTAYAQRAGILVNDDTCAFENIYDAFIYGPILIQHKYGEGNVSNDIASPIPDIIFPKTEFSNLFGDFVTRMDKSQSRFERFNIDFEVWYSSENNYFH